MSQSPIEQYILGLEAEIRVLRGTDQAARDAQVEADQDAAATQAILDANPSWTRIDALRHQKEMLERRLAELLAAQEVKP